MPSPRPPYAFPTPLWIEVTPGSGAIDAEGSIQFTATAHLDDGTTADYTHDPTTLWHSSDPTVATINSGFTNGGIAYGVGPGTTDISANWASVLGGVLIGVPTPPYTDEDPPYGVCSEIVTLTISAAAPVPDPEGRFCLALDSTTLEPNPVWTRLDTNPNLVTSYSIDRGRAYELDRTDTGRATVQIIDPDGILDPTLAPTTGDYLLLEDGSGHLLLEDGSGSLLLEEASAVLGIRPLMQATLGRYDPVADEWQLRFRGWVEDFDYIVDPTQQFNRLVVTLVDLFEILAAAEMQPGEFGDYVEFFDVGAEITVPPGSEGQVYFAADMQAGARITTILSNARITSRWRVIENGANTLLATTYSAGESPLTAIQEAADAEMPSVANVYCDRRGRICFHGRAAKFSPAATSGWDYREWKAGDGTAIAASPLDTAQIRELAFNRGLSRIINSASASPTGIADEDVRDQLVVDSVSVDTYGIRSWSATNLLTKTGSGGANSLVETKRFASYYVSNYKDPRNRVTGVSFRSLRPDDPRAAPNWALLAGIDIADSLELTAATGGGGLIDEAFFVEGIHEEARALTPEYDDVTLRLDLSPRAYFTTNPWA